MARAPTKMTRRAGTAKAPPGRTREAKVTPKIDKKDKSQICQPKIYDYDDDGDDNDKIFYSKGGDADGSEVT